MTSVKIIDRNPKKKTNGTFYNSFTSHIILVKLHRKEEKKNKSRRKGHNETQAQIGLGLGESGGAEGN